MGETGTALQRAVADAAAHPLSAKRAMLAALLIDAEADRLAGDGDVLAFRSGLAAKSEALALVFAVAGRELELVTEAVEVPLADYPKLSEADFMVSLYNQHSVQRVRIARGEQRWDVHAVLREAVDELSQS